jgi:Subtilase family
VHGGANSSAISINKALWNCAGLAIALTFCTSSVIAAPQQVDKNDGQQNNQAIYEALHSQALNAGSVRLIVRFNLPGASASLRTAAEVAVQKAAITATTSSFQSQYSSNLVGNYFNTTALLPLLEADFNAAGVEQLNLDPNVQLYGLGVSYRPMLTGINTRLKTGDNAALHLPQMPFGTNVAVAIIDTGVQSNVEFSSPQGNRIAVSECYSTPPFGFSTRMCDTKTDNKGVVFDTGEPCVGTAPLIQSAILNCGHGTHVAGIAASYLTSTNASGVARGAKVLAYQVQTYEPSSSNPQAPYSSNINSFDVADAMSASIADALANSLKLTAINLSLGYPGYRTVAECEETDRALRDAINLLDSTTDIAIVAATGNRYIQPDGQYATPYGMAYPACKSNVISVSAINKSGGSVNFSEYGFHPALGFTNLTLFPTRLPTFVTVGGDGSTTSLSLPAPTCNTAPGSVCSTKANVGGATAREARSGTSMSAPVITGLIARLAARYPALTGKQAAQLLKEHADTVTLTFAGIPVAYSEPNPLLAFRRTGQVRNLSSVSQCGTANVSWQAAAGYPGGSYRIRQAASVAALSGTGTAVGTQTSSTVTGSGTIYVQVQASLGADVGEWSDPYQVNITPCAPVTGLRSDSTPQNNCTFYGLRWDAVVPQPLNYELEEFCASGTQTPTSVTLNIPGSQTYQYTINGPLGANCAANKFRYRIKSCSTVGCSPMSSAIAHTPIVAAIRCPP